MQIENPISKDMVSAQMKFQRQYLAHLVDDIPDDRMCEQPGGIVNHPAWQVAHLAFVADSLVGMLEGTRKLEGQKATIGPGSIPQPQRPKYAPKAELLALLDDRRAELARLYHSATPQMLAAPNPIAILAARLPTRGHLIPFMIFFHEGTHMGQIALWRNVMGLERALKRMMV